MKKLMVAAMITLLGFSVKAVTVDWSVAYTYYTDGKAAGDWNGDEFVGGWAMYFIDAADFSQTQMKAALADGTYMDALASYGGLAEELTDEDGYGYGSSKKDTYANPSTMEGYFVLFNNKDAADATLAYVSESTTGTCPDMSGSTGVAEFGDIVETKDAKNWTATAVPEPTSGLLLLLGVAGLALRRRRA